LAKYPHYGSLIAYRQILPGTLIPTAVLKFSPYNEGMNSETVSPSTSHLDIISGPEHEAQLTRLLDASFNVPAPGHFLDDFPIWNESYGPQLDRMIRIGVWEAGELVSCAGVRLAEMHGPVKPIPVALIGAVATATTHRGRGLASRTVGLTLEWARERGAALAILWGSELELYERLGFELCGMQVRLPLAHAGLRPPGDGAVRIGRGWVPALAACLAARGSGLKLSVEDDSRWLGAHKNVEWYWLGDPADPMAYAAVGRGIDLHGLVHEWGGKDAQSLHTLLTVVQSEHPGAALLASQSHLRKWGFAPGLPKVEFLCMARALDTAKILDCNGIKVPADDPIFKAPDAAVCRLLFGPAEDVLPLWIWGLDAV
jgi:GNAT superfamily N-acetyltransferase